MRLRHAVFALAASVALAHPAGADDALPELLIGSPAPALDSVTWLQGEPVPTFEPGRVYVLDFWATWCGPCVASIPHVNELSKQYADSVDVIGLAVWPRKRMRPIDEFVEERSADMSYKIAVDIDLQTATAYMRSTASDSIPTCMVIDQQGRLAWIGHPMGGLDEVLEAVVHDEWDIDAAREAHEANRREQLRVQELQVKARPILEAVSEAQRDADWETALSEGRKLLELDPLFEAWRMVTYLALVQLGRTEEAAAEGRALLDGPQSQNPQMLNSFAWTIVEPGSVIGDEQRDVDLALAAITRANELTGKENANVLDTLARVHARRGDWAAAYLAQKRAVDFAANDEQAEALRATLVEYEVALEAAGDDDSAR